MESIFGAISMESLLDIAECNLIIITVEDICYDQHNSNSEFVVKPCLPYWL